MNTHENLRTLAAMDAPAAPFAFDEFEQRRARTALRRRNAVLGTAGSIVALGVVAIMAVVTQAPPLPDRGTVSVQHVHPDPARTPALVNLDQFDLTTELEDHIAMLDAELSMAGVQGAPVEQLRRLESTRAQLNQSLQRVTYAHSLLNL